MNSEDGRRRVVIEDPTPAIDGGRFPIKRTIGDLVTVEVDAFSDGHDLLSCALLFRKEEETAPNWRSVPMTALGNDRWRGVFPAAELGRYRYSFLAWVDAFRTWVRDLEKRVAAGQDCRVDFLIGADFVEEAARRATGDDSTALARHAAVLREGAVSPTPLPPDLLSLMATHGDRRFAVHHDPGLAVVVDRERARFSTWYELFPRSTGGPGRHGTLRDVAERLPYVAAMGFDVLYLPPIHPIGHDHRKGRNNSVTAGPNDPGSPWAIGSSEGGHTGLHPALGTFDDLHRLIQAAQEHSIELALDLALQCSPDHPYVQQHPEWFRRRPDGTVQYAENPPKKYEDIYPFDFESESFGELWEELRRVVLFWIEHGVRIFRVDNPHTKPFPFWEWLIGEIKRVYPDVIFLAEAFTRPKVMNRLAKLGFSQSYTYFTWRNTREELTRYFTDLATPQMREFFRPNLWPNTPDILPEYLQLGGRPAFAARLVMAATLGASYGIYGPAFELCENTPVASGKEEYLDSEKYQHRPHTLDELDRPESLRRLIARMNRVRRENPALQRDEALRFHPVSNDQLIAYSKSSLDGNNVVLVIVNLDPHHAHSGWVELPLGELGLAADQPYQVHDLLSDARYLWHGARNFVELHPEVVPAHLFRLRRRVRTERDFEYFL